MAVRFLQPQCIPLAKRGTLWVMAMTQSYMELCSEFSAHALSILHAKAVMHCMLLKCNMCNAIMSIYLAMHHQSRGLDSYGAGEKSSL